MNERVRRQAIMLAREGIPPCILSPKYKATPARLNSCNKVARKLVMPLSRMVELMTLNLLHLVLWLSRMPLLSLSTTS